MKFAQESFLQVLTLATLSVTVWIFVSTYLASRREISHTEAFFREHEKQQLDRLSHIDKSMDSLLDAVQNRDSGGDVRPLDDVRPMFDDIITSLRVLEKSVVEIDNKRLVFFNGGAVRKINNRQRELKELISRSVVKLSDLITRIYGFQGGASDV